MNVSDYNTIKTVLKKTERQNNRANIGIIDIAKERGYIDSSGRVTPEGRRFLQKRIENSSLTVRGTQYLKIIYELPSWSKRDLLPW